MQQELDRRLVGLVRWNLSLSNASLLVMLMKHVTRKTILSQLDVHQQWMEWHGLVTATDDVSLFSQAVKVAIGHSAFLLGHSDCV